MKSGKFVTLCLVILCIACGNEFIIPDPVKKPVDQENPSAGDKDDQSEDEPGLNVPQIEVKEGVLTADGKDELTYDLILKSGYNYETPDQSGNHASNPFRHIAQSYDNQLRRWVFDFILHIENDDDRGKSEIKDRQRNEIKTDSKSPSSMVAQQGETLRMRWKFKLPEGMQTTTSFSHIHQLKGIDNSEGNADVGMPLVTFTARSLSNGKQQLQVIFVAPSEQNYAKTTLFKADLAEFLGQWVEVEETVTFASDGKYQVSVKRLSDSKELVNVPQTSLPLWRTGSTGIRPKWGLYRWFGENRSSAHLLRDECLKFADFSIEKL